LFTQDRNGTDPLIETAGDKGDGATQTKSQ
jgi:hypothetical protein